jgi:hypothetical protein
MYKKAMWLKIDKEEFEVIIEALEHCNLNGLEMLLRTQTLDICPDDYRLTKSKAIEAANKYFAADDLIMGDYVEWTENNDALVMCWQKVGKEFISEKGCNCGEKK